MGLLIPILIMSGTGLACAVILVVAARFFAVHEDPRIETATGILPGINCGGCGYAGCADYAKAVVTAGVPVSLCGPGGAVTALKLAAFMGVDAGDTSRKTAIIRCGGDEAKAPRRFLYNGVADCKAAHAVSGGDKRCRYGCLGYGSCARVCPVNAIELTAGRLAVVHADICIGCGRCVRACPRALIELIPSTRNIHVLCRNRDKGPEVKKVCSVGCIACTICTKLAENQAIRMDGALAVVDYTKELTNTALVDKCPGHCIVKR